MFDADKAQAVSDATLTDCSAEVDMSKITGGSAKFGTGLVRFTGTYSPFVLPSAAVSNLSSAVNIRIDGATVNGNLAAASRFGGNGTFGGGTLSILEGATLDLSWGTMTLAATATLAEAPSSFTVVDENYASTGEVKLFSLTEGATVDDSWQAITVNVVSADGTESGYCKTVLRSDGLYGVRSGLTIRLR